MRDILSIVVALFLVALLSCKEELLPTSAYQNPDALLSPDAILSVGNIPDTLKPYLSQAPANRLYSITNFADTMVVIPTAMIINGDHVTNPQQLADSPLMTQLLKAGVRVVVGSNKAKDKANELVGLLGGVPFNGSHLTMIQYQGDTIAVTPVGNTPGYKYDYLSLPELALMIGLNQPSDESETTQNTTEIVPQQSARSAALDEPDWCSIKNVRFIPNSMSRSGAVYQWVPEASKYFFTTHEISKTLAYVSTIEIKSALTDIVAGTGQITFRENTIKTQERTKTYSTEIKMSASGTIIPGIKQTVWFSETKTKSYGISDIYSYGYTNYSSNCLYACCNAQGQYRLRINAWKHIGQVKGKAGVGYKVVKYFDKALFDKAKLPTVIWPVYCYNNASPLRIYWKSRGEPYMELVILRYPRNCKPKGCTAYKSCSGDKAVK